MPYALHFLSPILKVGRFREFGHYLVQSLYLSDGLHEQKERAERQGARCAILKFGDGVDRHARL